MNKSVQHPEKTHPETTQHNISLDEILANHEQEHGVKPLPVEPELLLKRIKDGGPSGQLLADAFICAYHIDQPFNHSLDELVRLDPEDFRLFHEILYIRKMAVFYIHTNRSREIDSLLEKSDKVWAASEEIKNCSGLSNDEILANHEQEHGFRPLPLKPELLLKCIKDGGPSGQFLANAFIRGYRIEQHFDHTTEEIVQLSPEELRLFHEILYIRQVTVFYLDAECSRKAEILIEKLHEVRAATEEFKNCYGLCDDVLEDLNVLRSATKLITPLISEYLPKEDAL